MHSPAIKHIRKECVVTLAFLRNEDNPWLEKGILNRAGVLSFKKLGVFHK